MHPGEQETVPSQMKAAIIPDDHRWEILVRQIKKGQRARLAFCRNIQMEIVDVEAVIHAIFDTVASPRSGEMITVEEIAALAKRYHLPEGSAPN